MRIIVCLVLALALTACSAKDSARLDAALAVTGAVLDVAAAASEKTPPPQNNP